MTQHQHLQYTPSPLHKLMPREGEAMLYAALGDTTKEAAREMGISPGTVKDYLDRAREKLHARNIAHLVSLAWEYGLITVRSSAFGLFLAMLGIASIHQASDISGDLLTQIDYRARGRTGRGSRGGRGRGRNNRRQREYPYLPPILEPEEATA